MTFATTLGKYTGILVAKVAWLTEVGVRVGSGYYIAHASLEALSDIAEEHAIDHTDPDAVSNNLYDCLEFIS